MKKDKICFMITGVVFFSLFFLSAGKTESSNEWVSYRTSELGHYCYDKSSIIKVSPQIIRVWSKVQLSPFGKDFTIQKQKNDNGPTDGWEKLNETRFLYELDCVNNTYETRKVVNYNEQGKILSDMDIPNPATNPILSDLGIAKLKIKVCKK